MPPISTTVTSVPSLLAATLKRVSFIFANLCTIAGSRREYAVAALCIALLSPGITVGLPMPKSSIFMDAVPVDAARTFSPRDELETAIQLAGSPEMIAARGYAFARAGASARAREALGVLITMSGNRYVSASLVAQVHAALGEPTLALDWLERAADAHAADLAWLRVRPVFDTLRGETRFGAILERVAP